MLGESVLLRVFAALLAASLLGNGWQALVASHRATAAAEREVALQTAIAQAQATARKREQDWQETIDDLAALHNRQLADAQRAEADLVADLRDGRERFRRMWAGCEAAAARVSAYSGAAGEPDGSADDRAASAGRIVRAAAECDEKVRALQQYARAISR